MSLTLKGAHEPAHAAPCAPAHQRDIGYDDLDKFKYYTIGPACAFCCRFVLFPFSLVKTRLQMQKGDGGASHQKVRPGLGTANAAEAMRYSGTLDAFGKIIMHEGPRGLFKGFGVSCIGIASGQLYITSYEIIRQEARRLNDTHQIFSSAAMDVIRNAVAGGSASLLSQTVVVPVDIISQKQMMMSQERRPQSIMTLSRDIFAREGIAGFYRGFFASVMVRVVAPVIVPCSRSAAHYSAPPVVRCLWCAADLPCDPDIHQLAPHVKYTSFHFQRRLALPAARAPSGANLAEHAHAAAPRDDAVAALAALAAL